MPIVLLFIFVSFIIVLSLHLLPTSLLLQVAHARQATFGDPVHLDDNPEHQTDAHIDSSGDNVYSSYSSEPNSMTGEILFTMTTDKGTSFSDPKVLSDVGHFAFLSDIAASGEDVYVTWTDITTESNIVLVRSNDNGASFSDPVKINGGTNARSPEVAVFDNNVYLVWQDFINSPDDLTSDIFFAVSTDGGITFGSPIDVSDTQGTLNRNPSVATFGNDVYVVWSNCNIDGTNCKILYTKSSDVGSSFTSPVVVASPESSLPDIKVLEDMVYIVYSQSQVVDGIQVRDIFLIKSTDSGSTFSSPINLSLATEVPNPNPLQIGSSNNPHIDLSGDNVAITWDERVSPSDPHNEIFFVGSTDAGSTFTEPMSISGNLGDGSNLNDVTISGTNVYSTWTTLEDDFNIYFAAGIITPSLTPEEGIEKVIDTINNMNLKSSIKTSLNGPLHNAIKLLTDNDPSNDNDVCNKLDSFLGQLNAKEANGQLTSQQAAELRAQATAIETSLGCSPANQLASGSLQADNSSGTIILPF